MGRGFAYQWNPTKLASDSEAFNRTIIENFRQLESFINGYIPTFEADTTSLILPTDLTVTGDLTVSGGVFHGDGKQHIHVYDAAGSQSFLAGDWRLINLDTEVGTHSAGTFTFVAASDKVTILETGVYLALGEVTFQANEAGNLRIMGGASELARSDFSAATTPQVVGLFYVTAGTDITFEVFPDTAANSTASPSSRATFLEVVKLHGVA